MLIYNSNSPAMPNSPLREDCGLPPELGSILLVEENSELRCTRRMVLGVLGHPVLAVAAYREICALPADSNCRLIVVDLRPSEQEALRVANHARRTWPSAKILLLGTPSQEFDDPLYDEAFPSSWSPELVVELTRRLLDDAGGLPDSRS